jgi:hypothetical protein
MKAVASKELIEVDDLRVGMFVHLDMSWMSHPFPLGSFRIANDEQVATIRSLGVQRVRWTPTQSDVLPPVEPGGCTGAASLDSVSHDDAGVPSAHAPISTITPTESFTAPVPLESPEAAARRARRRELAGQRAELQL